MNDLPDIASCNDVKLLVRSALKEDLGETGDVTTISLVPPEVCSLGQIIARCPCVVSGTTIAEEVFLAVDSELDVEITVPDGQRADTGAVLLEIKGRAASILTAERTALNFTQRMTGIATRTAEFAERAGKMMVLDTRKTTPCLRALEKYAVLCGGGNNHRFGLFDRVLIKDNHRKLWGKPGLGEAVKTARLKYPALEIEIEVESLDELKDALSGRPDWILLDNMTSDMMKQCVDIVNGDARLEASGGIDIDRIDEVAATGVDAVSLGCLTHSITSADLSLELVQE